MKKDTGRLDPERMLQTMLQQGDAENIRPTRSQLERISQEVQERKRASRSATRFVWFESAIQYFLDAQAYERALAQAGKLAGRTSGKGAARQSNVWHANTPSEFVAKLVGERRGESIEIRPRPEQAEQIEAEVTAQKRKRPAFTRVVWYLAAIEYFLEAHRLLREWQARGRKESRTQDMFKALPLPSKFVDAMYENAESEMVQVRPTRSQVERVNELLEQFKGRGVARAMVFEAAVEYALMRAEERKGLTAQRALLADVQTERRGAAVQLYLSASRVKRIDEWVERETTRHPEFTRAAWLLTAVELFLREYA